jgi:hypothetical protein
MNESTASKVRADLIKNGWAANEREARMLVEQKTMVAQLAELRLAWLAVVQAGLEPVLRLFSRKS